jgi:c-di-GMP-related signal transduction protein
MDVFVARQPIFDRSRHLVAYELLFRSDAICNKFDGTAAARATTQVIANSLLSIGWENMLGGKQAFINFDLSLLLAGLHSVLPRESVVLEILESVTPDQDLVAACQELHQQGYAIALDDFVDDPRYEPLLRMAKLIKVDTRTTSKQEQERLLRTYHPRGLALLAEKVETHEEFNWARRAGYDLFQGYFFARPMLVRGKQIPVAKITCLKLLAEMQHTDLDFECLQMLISPDVALSYKLLRYANSPLFCGYAGIRSVKQALVILGEANIRHWVALAALPTMAADKPSELITHSLVRARFCERLAFAAGIPEYKLGFLMGLFSLLDALIDLPLEEALNQVSVPSAITRPLLGTSPENDAFGSVYELVCRYEVGEWSAVTTVASKLKILVSEVGQAYAEATLWAQHALHSNIRANESRNHARHAASGTLRIAWQDGTGRRNACEAELINISVAGLKLEVAENIPIHATVSLDEPALGISGTGSVRYCHSSQGKYAIGLEFKNGTGWREPA